MLSTQEVGLGEGWGFTLPSPPVLTCPHLPRRPQGQGRGSGFSLPPVLRGPCPWPLGSGNGGASPAAPAANPAVNPPPRGRLKFFDGVSPVPLATSPGVARAVDPPHGGLKWGGGGPQPPPPHAAVAQWPHREEPRHGRVLQEVKGAPVGELHWGEQEATGPREKLWGLGLQPALIGGLVISELPSPLVVRATGGE